jgi:uncharacterized protein
MSAQVAMPEDLTPRDASGGSDVAAADAGRVDRKLLELLVCPLTKTPLIYDAERQELISRAAGLAFPIVNGMPVLVAREARLLDH